LPHIFDRLTFNAAARYDLHSRISSQVSPSVGAALIRGDYYNLALRINYGKSYRPPNFNDMYYEGYRVVGNPDLLPERSRGGDAGVTFSAPVYGRIRTEFTYFRNDMDDIILWRKRFDGIFSPYNLSRSRLFGSETSLEWRLPGNILELSASHSFNRAVNKANNGRETASKQTDSHNFPAYDCELSDLINGFEIPGRQRKIYQGSKYKTYGVI
jgi:outer membrane cobalamin receptor